VQKNNAGSKRETSITEFKDYVLPVGKEKKLKGNHLPEYMGCFFFVFYYIEIFIWRDIFKIRRNNNGNLSGRGNFIQPEGNFISVSFYAG
jgi:hypothetical protein